MVLMPSPEGLTPEQERVLLHTARDSIAYGLDHGQPLPVRATDHDPALQAIRGTFVTLQIAGRLRGCIGTLEARLPLAEDVAQHAYAAAFQDPRFPALSREELARVDIHISVLSPHTPLPFADEADLVAKLRPGVDGLVIAKGSRRATFLPSVWESLPDPAQFLVHLKLKAGIDSLDTGADRKAWRYTALSVPSGHD